MYRIPEEPGPLAIYTRLAAECPEHAHLRSEDNGPDVVFLLRDFEIQEQGRVVLGAVHLPKVQGKLKRLFDWLLDEKFGRVPDYLILLDGFYWDGADDRSREILVYHEMCHCVQDTDKDGDPRFDEEGTPVWAIKKHDVEEFSNTVRRYGAYDETLQGFIAAAVEHDKA